MQVAVAVGERVAGAVQVGEVGQVQEVAGGVPMVGVEAVGQVGWAQICGYHPD